VGLGLTQQAAETLLPLLAAGCALPPVSNTSTRACAAEDATSLAAGAAQPQKPAFLLTVTAAAVGAAVTHRWPTSWHEASPRII
jgi:hypothetical protein